MCLNRKTGEKLIRALKFGILASEEVAFCLYPIVLLLPIRDKVKVMPLFNFMG
jgi:hypothetical protein